MKKGYIEGYYGRLFSKEEREMVVNHMGNLKMDFYIYGPKEDPYHRLNWQKPYPKKQSNELKAFLRSSIKNKIKPVFALSPGMSMDAGSTQDIKNLKNKINQAKKLGFRHFAIFFDDLDQKKDQNLASSHAEILELVSKLLKNLKGSSLMFCPTIYCNSFAKGDISNNDYLLGLASKVNKKIPLLWTGREVVSPNIKDTDISSLKKIFKNPVIIWDNYYANDYCSNKFFIGSYSGRSVSKKTISAIGMNPTGMAITDCIILDRFVSKKSTSEILQDYGIPRSFMKVFPYFDGPFKKSARKLDIKTIERLQKAEKELCIDWKSDLQLEWSQHLWRFFGDLHLLKKRLKKENKKKLEEFTKRRYSEPLSQQLLDE